MESVAVFLGSSFCHESLFLGFTCGLSGGLEEALVWKIWEEEERREGKRGNKERGNRKRKREKSNTDKNLLSYQVWVNDIYNTVLTWHCFTMCAPSATNTAWYSICSCTCTFNHQVATGTCSWAKLVCHQLACSTKNYQVFTTKKFCAAALQIQ